MSKAQVTLFVVVGILIVSAGIVFAYFQFNQQLPVQVRSVEDYFSSCVSNLVKDATVTAGGQAGYVELPEFVSASDYAPFSSQFFFLGSEVPYWFYMSGNGIQKEQVPSISLIQKQIADYIKNNIAACGFDQFTEQGYEIHTEEIKNVQITVSDFFITTEINYPITVKIGETSRRVEVHRAVTTSSFGKMYSDAKRIYDYEKGTNFLERYSIDALTLNAPTTDVVLSCAPKTWSQLQIESDVKKSLEANIPTIKLKGNYYTLKNDKYFVQDISVSSQANFMYSSNWPSVLEVWPSEDGILRADPVGMQEGLGILGFCYVPYHFVYSIRYPVMIQLIDGEELFQFPVVVIIDRNKPRQADVKETPEQFEAELCNHKIEQVSVTTLGSDLEPVDASISFKCHTTVCSIGSTNISEDSTLVTNFPQCVNGFIVASAQGYKTTKVQVSTNEPASVNVIMPKLYELNANLLGNSAALSSESSAIIHFISDDYSYSLYWPVQKSIRLAEGSYNVTAFLFQNGNITFEAQTKRQCVKAPAAGLLGLLGIQTENCFDMNVPSQLVTQVVTGGGTASIDVTEDDLKAAKSLTINIPTVEQPKDMFALQQAYTVIDTNTLSLSFR